MRFLKLMNKFTIAVLIASVQAGFKHSLANGGLCEENINVAGVQNGFNDLGTGSFADDYNTQGHPVVAALSGLGVPGTPETAFTGGVGNPVVLGAVQALIDERASALDFCGILGNGT